MSVLEQLLRDSGLPVAGVPTVPQPQQPGNVLAQLLAQSAGEEEPQGRYVNPIVALGAGVARGVMEPLGVLPPINEINERLKSYAGNTLGSKIGYGLGFFGGMLVPGNLAWKAGGMATKAILAERAAEMAKRAYFIRGAVGGALFGAGRAAEDPQDWIKHVLSDAALGGVGDVVLTAGLAAKFGRSKRSKPAEALDAIANDTEMSPEAAYALGQSHQLIDEVIRPTVAVKRTVAEQQYLDAMRARPGATVPAVEAEEKSFAARKLAMMTGLEKLPWESMRPGTFYAVPAPHGDVEDLAKIINATKVMQAVPVSGEGKAPMVLAGLRRVTEVSPTATATSAPSAVSRGVLQLGKIDELNEGRVVHMSIDELASYADPNVPLTRLRQEDRGYLDNLKGQIEREGMQRPVTLRRDTQGLIIDDGMHRLVVAQELGLKDVPVVLRKSDRIVTPVISTTGSGVGTVTRMSPTTRGVGSVEKRYEDISSGLVEQYNKYGFMRGQSGLYKGSEWIILKPAKGGMMLTQPGRLTKPIYAKFDEVMLLPVVDDLSSPRSLTNLAKTTAEFVGEHGLWPGAEGPTGVKGLVEEAATGWRQAFDKFTAERGIFGKDRIALQNHMVDLQRRHLTAADPALGSTLKKLEKQAKFVLKRNAPEGIVIEYALQRGLTMFKEVGKTTRIGFRDTKGQVVAHGMSKSRAVDFLHGYQVAAENLAPELSLADGLMPPTGGGRTPPHTAGESMSPSGPEKLDWTLPGWTSFLSGILPRMKYFQNAEDKLIQQGVTSVRPYTIAQRISRASTAFRNEEEIWKHGGKLSDGTEVEGILRIFGKKAVRGEKREALFDLIEAPKAKWAEMAQESGLNERELDVARRTREWYNKWWDRHVRDPEIDLTADEFIENYMPHYRHKSDAEAMESLKIAFDRNPSKLNRVAAQFASEMTRKGVMKKWEKDPLFASVAYMRSGLYKSYMKRAINESIEQINALPEHNAEARLLKRSLINYMALSAYGQPEMIPSLQAGIARMADTLNLDISNLDSTKLVNTLISMNYGAFLGFRPSMVVRNFSQTIFTTYPMLGGKYTGYGLKLALRGDYDTAFREVVEAGALTASHSPVAAEDAIYALKEGGAAFGKIGRAGLKTTEVGLSWFQKADHFNRVVAFFGQKKKMMDAWVKHNGNFTDEFMRDSGLDFFGDAVKRQFKEQGFTEGIEAGKWLGVHAANDTQWLYQLGAGPSLFSVGVGRLAGQYGTWPTWFASYITQGAKNLKGVDKAVFAARSLAAHGAIVGAGATVGLNFSRWTGLSSLSWMGGPAVDWFNDIRSIWTGVTLKGEPTAQSSLAMSELGIKDQGPGALPFLPGTLGRNIDVVDWGKLYGGFFGAITPGWLGLRDAKAMVTAKSPTEFFSKFLGAPMESGGYEWPEISTR